MLIASKYEEIYAPEVRDFVHICDKVRPSRCTSLRLVVREADELVSIAGYFFFRLRWPNDFSAWPQAYSRDEIIKMEGTILNALDWQLGGATPWHFLLRFGKAGELDEKTKFTAQYIVERYLQEMKSVRHPPSQIAAAAVGLARRVNGKSAWVRASPSGALHVPAAARHSAVYCVHGRFIVDGFFIFLLGLGRQTAELQKYSQYSEQTLQPVSTELLEVAKRAPHSSLKAVHRKSVFSKKNSADSSMDSAASLLPALAGLVRCSWYMLAMGGRCMVLTGGIVRAIAGPSLWLFTSSKFLEVSKLPFA